MFTTYPLPAKVQMFVLGHDVSPANAYYSGTGKRLSRFRSVVCANALSYQRSGNGARQWSRVFLGPHHRGALSILDASLRFAQASYSALRGQLCVWNKELLVESCVFSAVIGVFAGLTSASVRMHRKREWHSRFAKDAASWRRKFVESQSG